MVETRQDEAGGQRSIKPGGYEPDKVYQQLDQGYGDVGVDQEPDAARTQADDTRGDPLFEPSREALKAADTEAREEAAADVPLKEDLADLKAGPDEAVATTGKGGEPVPVVPTSAEELEGQEAYAVPDTKA